ncbi:MAG TPA: type 1 glutamine amidotransferase [Sphingomonas sp.]|nr:type 1 glutamine amidotransferase [Sphingomonas sp.]
MPYYLIAESELPDERAARRARAGKSSGETYAATLAQMVPDATIAIIAPADDYARTYSPDELRAFDAVFLTGSPMHVYEQTPEVDRLLTFMRAVFASRVPSFGSCAGLQIAVAAAGGRVRKMRQRMEAGVARRITATEAGRAHPLLAGRPSAWDAAAIHGDEVDELPPGSILLASNAVTPVQAAEITFDGGTFWGVQYHPELSLEEIASALRSQAADLVSAGLADEEADVSEHAALLDGLHADPDDRPIRWALGVDDELAKEANRRREITNFLAYPFEARGERR